MTGELKDISVIIDGGDPVLDGVVAGLALRLAHHHGAQLTAFEETGGEPFEESSWVEDARYGPYASVEFCGVSSKEEASRFDLKSPLSALRLETRSTGGWTRRAGLDNMLAHVRCADLVVVGSPFTARGWPTAAPSDIIIGAGRPVLVVPRKFAQRHPMQRKIGHRVLVAWNASAPSARAVHDALPFLRRAEEITLLFVEDQHGGAGGDLVATISGHLERHGVNLRAEVSPKRSGAPSGVILDRLAELDVDLLVMGAFSRSRLSETWFGGASEDLLHQVGVPILTGH